MEPRQLEGKDLDYEYIQPIGKGAFGTVTKVRRKKDGKIMACKTIDCSSNPQVLRYAAREINVWVKFGNEKYIAEFSYDYAWNPTYQIMRMYMEYYPGGDLQGVIDNCQFDGTTVHPFMAAYWALEIARGVKTCHDFGIIHRDLNPRNILLSLPYDWNDMLWAASNGIAFTPKQKTQAKDLASWIQKRPPWCHISDFGLGKFSAAAFLQNNTLASFSPIGTHGYMAPETMGRSAVFSTKSDIYSLGCVLIRLCQNLTSSSGASSTNAMSVGACYPMRLRKIISRSLDTDPANRPTSREVVNESSEAYIDIWSTPFCVTVRERINCESLPTAERRTPIFNDTTILSTIRPIPQSYWKIAGTLEGHLKWVTAVAFSPDGKQIASGSGDGTVRLWDSATGTARGTLEGHLEGVTAVAFSPADGKQIASGSYDGTVRLWDSATGTARGTLEGHLGGVTAVAFSPADGKQIASGSDDGTVRLWDSATGPRALSKGEDNF